MTNWLNRSGNIQWSSYTANGWRLQSQLPPAKAGVVWGVKQVSITVEFRGVDELIKRLSDPRPVKTAIKNMLVEATKIGQAAAKQAVSGGTGIAERSIGRSVWTRVLQGRVYSRIKYERAMLIEEGRSPGNPPSILAVLSWMTGTPYRRDLIFTRRDEKRALKIQESIRRRGSKGKHYLEAANKAIEKEMPSLERQVMRQIKNMVARG